MLGMLSRLDQLERKINKWMPPTVAGSGAPPEIVIEPGTPEDLPFEEFARSCWIRSGKNLIPFSPLYPHQLAIATLAAAFPGLLVVKDRQLGITELICCWMLWRSRHPAYAGAAFSMTEVDAHKISRRTRNMRPDLKWATDSAGVRQLAGGGQLNFRPSTDNATRGLESIWDLLFDEAGFVPNISEMYAASTPSQEMLGDDARVFVVSTIPQDWEGSWFWDRLTEDLPSDRPIEDLLLLARHGGHLNLSGIELPEIPGLVAIADSSGWCRVIIGHKAHPVYGADPQFVENRRKKKKLTLEQAHREYNLTPPTQATDQAVINRFTEAQIQAVSFDPEHDLHLSFDFNRHPATCLFSQAIDDQLIHLEEIYLLNSDTFALSALATQRVAELNPRARIVIHGDASGKQRTANSQSSNWEIVIDAFKARGLQFLRRWPESNPPIIDTINAINFLCTEERLIVDPRCYELIKDFKRCEGDGKGGIDKKKDPMRSHLLDCARYTTHDVYPYRNTRDLSWITG